MRLYYFTSSHWALDNVARRRIKVSQIEALNDPFELLSPALKQPEDRAKFRELKSDLSRTVGLICFSASWRNPVQWSHYGDHHRGCCLGFDVPEQLAKRVTYLSKRLRVDSLMRFAEAGKLDEAFMENALSAKFAHWRYEKEYRVFAQMEGCLRDGDHYFQRLNDKGITLRLSEFIVGPLSLVTRSQVATALGDLVGSVRATKARLAFQTFNVCKQRKEALWAD
ncbi:MAG: DUF2971 domain-containing protein [Hydrogenophaga sp.]|nr:DUF2971 domain-containing protein [Hydrogenophaga sp.]MDP1782328.1 DUF2971 domain-containing protein [Hydrogenophaga sp.]